MLKFNLSVIVFQNKPAQNFLEIDGGVSSTI